MGLANVNRNVNFSMPTDMNIYNPYFMFGNPFNFSTPNFNTNLIQLAQLFKINTSSLINSLASTPTYSRMNQTNANLQNVGYSAAKGEKLANIARQNATGFKKLCATYVKKDIEQAGLGKYKQGHAFQCDDILDQNSNFKEISTKGLDLTSLPAGCVLVYDRGVSGYSKKYGHIEITDGNGNAFSDGKTQHIKPGAKVYVPVSTNYMA